MGFAISLVKHFPFLCLFHFESFRLFFSLCGLRIIYMSVLISAFMLLTYYIGLSNLESINLSFTVVTDTGLRKLSGLTSLRTLNLDARHVTDAGLSALTSKSFQCFSLQSINCDCQQVGCLPLYDAVTGSSRLKTKLPGLLLF